MKYKDHIVVSNDGRLYASEIKLGKHLLIGDEPVDLGGADLGPTAHQLLLGSLGSCTVITLRMYANRKKWDLKKVSVALNMEKVQENGNDKTIIYRKVELEGNLDEDQRSRLMIIADKCPVHKTLTSQVEFRELG